MSAIIVNSCRASNYKGFDKRGYLRKCKSFEAESASPRQAARECLDAMRAGKSRSTEISVMAGQRDGSWFRTSISFGDGGTPSWRIPATDEGVNSLPDSL